MDWNQILEDAIIGKVTGSLVDAGYRVELCDQDGGGLFCYAVPDAGDKPKDGFKFWVQLVPGNGCDVISDFTTNIEADIAPAGIVKCIIA